jgi:hypothetical protein
LSHDRVVSKEEGMKCARKHQVRIPDFMIHLCLFDQQKVSAQDPPIDFCPCPVDKSFKNIIALKTLKSFQGVVADTSTQSLKVICV